MGDSSVNYATSIWKVRSEIASLESTYAKYLVTAAELKDNWARNLENIEANRRAVAERHETLASLEKEHGSPPDPTDGHVTDLAVTTNRGLGDLTRDEDQE